MVTKALSLDADFYYFIVFVGTTVTASISYILVIKRDLKIYFFYSHTSISYVT